MKECIFGKVLKQLLKKKKISATDLSSKLGLTTSYPIWGYTKCKRYPSVVEVEGKVSIVDLAKALNLTFEEEYMLYKSLIDNFYPNLAVYFPEIKDEDLTDKNIKSLVEKKFQGITWSQIYDDIPESSVRKIKQLRADLSLLNGKDKLKEFMKHLDLKEKDKAKILLYFLIKKGAFNRFIDVLRKKT